MRILFLDLDTLRPDHLGCYGYLRNTSPNIDSLAAKGVRFDRYYCSDAPCLPSRAAMLTGMLGIHSGIVGHGGTTADMRHEGRPREFMDLLDNGGYLNSHGLFSLFRSAGLRTVSISPFAQRHSAWWFCAGLNEMYNTGKFGGESAEDITPTVLKWVQDNAAEDNWMLHINYWDAHTTYRVPESFGNPFENDAIPDWLTDGVVASHQSAVGPHTAREVNMYHDIEAPEYPRQPGAIRTAADARRMIDGYDCGIAYMDMHIGQILKALDEQGVLEDIAVIITSDHGENMGEFGIYGEHGTADEATCHIPMIIKLPGCNVGTVDKGLHYNIDLLPTLAEYFNIERSKRWDGQSYLRSLTEGADTGRDYLVVSQCAHVVQRSVRWDKWLYIRSYHDGYRLLPDEMLFDIETDPHERHDLASVMPDRCAQAAHMLLDWHDRAMRSQRNNAPDPIWTVLYEGGPYHTRGFLRRYCDRLEATGRAHIAEQLMDKYPDELPPAPQ